MNSTFFEIHKQVVLGPGRYIDLLYAYCPFSAVIGQIMVTWPPYKIDIGVHNSLDSLSILFEWAVGI